MMEASMTTTDVSPPTDPDKEEWRPVAAYRGLYEVSSFGRVKSLERYVPHGKRMMLIRERILKPQAHGDDGGLVVFLSKNGKPKLHLVHILVARAFIPNPDNLPEVNHIDFNRANNRWDNLEWCTCLYNHRHAMLAGRRAKKLSDSAIKEIQGRLATGESQQSIGDAFGVSQAHVSRIKLGRTWERHTLPTSPKVAAET
jgi:hypothetical protein